MAFLSIENLYFSYKDVSVIQNFSLDVKEGSFTTLLGESGCGKTTLLRLINGFLKPDSGTIKINGITVNEILPNKRKIGMVFQDYALFPHLTVMENLLYGLKINQQTKNQKKENEELAFETAKTLGIENLLKRYPQELSGGQQQRVALGRVIVLKPNLLLMDEPLSSLDTKLRIKVREELKEIQKKLKITTVYVTHDQEEALSLSDEIAIINKGRLVQKASPEELYYKPKDFFVADFIGRANFLDSKLIRPEWIKISKVNSNSENADLSGFINSKEFLGSITRFKIQVDKYQKEILVDQMTVESNEFEIHEKVNLKILKSWEF